jgi:hypothetical protein
MTPRERAEKVQADTWNPDLKYEDIVLIVEQAIIAAEEAKARAEREALIELCENVIKTNQIMNGDGVISINSIIETLIRMIRARSEKEKQKINIGWIKVKDKLPAEGEVVETKIKTTRPLIYRNGVWGLLDNSTIVICTPTHWRRSEKGD